MSKLDNLNRSSSSMNEDSNLVFSGKLELTGNKSSLRSIENNVDDKSLIMRVGLNNHQMSEILSSAGEKPKDVHLILYDSENNRSLPAEVINESTLPGKYELEVNYSLTKCEKAILKSLTGGLKYEDIAKKHFISIHTVKNHVTNIFRKLGVNNRSLAALKYINFIKILYCLIVLLQPEILMDDIIY